LSISNSMESGFVALAKSDPATYALSCLVNRTFPTPIPDGFYCTNSDGWFVDASTNAWQYATNTQYNMVVSPEGPDSYWATATAYWMHDLQVIRSNIPISIVLNGGEYGLNVEGFAGPAWKKDPRVQAATNAIIYTNMGLSMSRYSSNRKAHQLGFLTAAIQQLLPDRELYIFYDTGNEQNRYTYFSDWFGGVDSWGWNSDVMVTNTDLPSFEDYYSYPPGWLAQTNPLPNDILTRHLNAVGYNLTLGHSTNYSWVCGGWGVNNQPDTNFPANFSDIPHYMGFLKCLYTGGMVGAVAGYFSFPMGGFDASFPTNSPPQWLQQIQALAQVHALFSHFDAFLSSGDLLSGPQFHLMAHDQPAYEFTNTVADTTARVLARKLRSSNQWLITAWASTGGDRNVTVTIPTLGSVSLLARACGSVYQATTSNLTLVDVNGLLPTAAFTAPAPPTYLHVIPGGSGP
jgi:hypothetical protein